MWHFFNSNIAANLNCRFQPISHPYVWILTNLIWQTSVTGPTPHLTYLCGDAYQPEILTSFLLNPCGLPYGNFLWAPVSPVYSSSLNPCDPCVLVPQTTFLKIHLDYNPQVAVTLVCRSKLIGNCVIALQQCLDGKCWTDTNMNIPTANFSNRTWKFKYQDVRAMCKYALVPNTSRIITPLSVFFWQKVPISWQESDQSHVASHLREYQVEPSECAENWTWASGGKFPLIYRWSATQPNTGPSLLVVSPS